MRRRLPAVIEESLLALDRTVISGGHRGVLVEMATEHIVRLLNAGPVDVCAWQRASTYGKNGRARRQAAAKEGNLAPHCQLRRDPQTHPHQ